MVIDIIGWIGSVMVIMAYALNIIKRLASDATWYYLLNIIGSACLILNTFYHHAIPSAVVNIIWVFIAMVALFKKKWGAARETLLTNRKSQNRTT